MGWVKQKNGWNKSFMEEKYKELLKYLYAILKPLGYRKEASDYRLFRPDGLARIVNIQRNKNNTAQCCMFTINIGVYFEKSDMISNCKFKEYDCQIRKRVKPEENEEWWIIENDTDMEVLKENLQTVLGHIEKWFDNFISKEETIHRILDKSAETVPDTMIMSYPTAKLIAEMGYPMEVATICNRFFVELLSSFIIVHIGSSFLYGHVNIYIYAKQGADSCLTCSYPFVT